MAQEGDFCQLQECPVEELVDDAKKTLSRLENLLHQFEDLCQLKRKNKTTESFFSAITGFLKQIDEPQMKLAVIGTVSSGKSTVINGLIGRNIAPKRENACTFLPVAYKHNAVECRPFISFTREFVRIFNDLLSPIRAVLSEGDGERKDDELKQMCLKQLVGDIARGDVIRLEEKMEEPRVVPTLLFIQDLLRLIHEDVRLQDFVSPCSDLFKIEMLPVIHVKFEALIKLLGEENFGNKKSLLLIDTPGPNDSQSQSILRAAVKHITEYVQAICCVSDASAFGQSHNDEMIKTLNPIVQGKEARVYVILNKFDLVDTELKEDQLRMTLNTHIPKIPSENVFVSKAVMCTVANQVRGAMREITVGGQEEDLGAAMWKKFEGESWFKKFMKISCGDSEKRWRRKTKKWDTDDWHMEVDDCFEGSFLDKPMDLMVRKCYENASLICLQATSKRILEDVFKPLEVKMGIMGTSQLSLEEIRTALNYTTIKLGEIPTIKEEIEKHIEEILSNLEIEMKQMQESEIQKIGSLFQRGSSFQRLCNALRRKSEQFASKEEALQYVNAISDMASKVIETMEHDLLSFISLKLTVFLRKLEKFVASKYEEVISGLGEEDICDGQNKLTNLLGFEVDMPNPHANEFPLDLDSLILQSKPQLKFRKADPLVLWFLKTIDYIFFILKKPVYSLKKSDIQDRIKGHYTARIEQLFLYCTDYFTSIFQERSDAAISFISRKFSEAHANLQQKQAQIESDKNVAEAEHHIKFLHDTYLQNVKNQHMLLVESLRASSENGDRPQRYIVPNDLTNEEQQVATMNTLEALDMQRNQILQLQYHALDGREENEFVQEPGGVFGRWGHVYEEY